MLASEAVAESLGLVPMKIGTAKSCERELGWVVRALPARERIGALQPASSQVLAAGF